MTSANTNSVLYDAGYNDAFNKRPSANEDADYLDGYKDGTLLYERRDGVVPNRASAQIATFSSVYGGSSLSWGRKVKEVTVTVH